MNECLSLKKIRLNLSFFFNEYFIQGLIKLLLKKNGVSQRMR